MGTLDRDTLATALRDALVETMGDQAADFQAQCAVRVEGIIDLREIADHVLARLADKEESRHGHL